MALHFPFNGSKLLLSNFLLLTIIATTSPVHAQQSAEKVDLEVINRIKDEEQNRSQIMETASYLTDVMGPRLTNSPNLKQAQQYAIDKLRAFGISNPHLEAWGPFGRGWALEGFSAAMISPSFTPLIAYPKAWSPDTNGPLQGEAILFDVRTETDLLKYKGKLKGKIVLFSPARPVEPNFLPQPQRTSDEDLRKLGEAKPPSSTPPVFQMPPERRARFELNYKKWQMVIAEGAAVVLEAGAGDAGTVYVTAMTIPAPLEVPDNQRPHAWDLNPPRVPPQIVVAAEQYNRMVRLVMRGVPVQIELNLKAHFYDQDLMSANVIGEIPGTDLRDEVVMLGGCLDSWHTGTGATDNAAGAAVALEVMRLFQTLRLKPRRTVRIGLWSAEEQGALGSQAYVAAHFGKRTNDGKLDLKPEHEKFSAYFNLDYGGGRIRGIFLQGNESVRPIFHAWLAPFKEMGAETITSAGIFATDHNSFDAVGLPGFQFLRDFMETNPRTAHTNMDVYDHLLADDLKQTAIIAAAFVYQAAMRDEKLPRMQSTKSIAH
jgi:hypothetical protein